MTMAFAFVAVGLAVALFVGMLVLLEVGRRLGMRQLTQDADGAQAGTGVIEGSVFGLLGLLLAFTFSGAASRFDARRQLIIDEANAIGTAWLRIDLLPPDAQPPIRDGLRRYLDARLGIYQKLPDAAAAERELARSLQIRDEVWANVMAVVRTDSGERARMLLIPSLNESFDVAEARMLATRIHPPGVIYAILTLLALIGALLAGYGMAKGRGRNWIHMVCFAGTIALAVYVIVELEYPRSGLIRVDRFDLALIELRNSMK